MRTLGLKDSIAIIIGIVIGVGIFKIPAEVAKYLPSPGFIFLAWAAGGLISLLGAFCYAEFAVLLPETGGTYIYLKESYGNLTAFAYSWAELLLIRPGSMAAVAFIFSDAFASFFSLPLLFLKPCAMMAIIFLSVINLFGLSAGKCTQNFLVLTTLFMMVMTLTAAVLLQKGSFEHFFVSEMGEKGASLRNFFLALVPILWTYGGWHENTFLAGETKDPSRVLPLALIGGLGIIILLYLAMNFVYLYLVPLRDLVSSQLVMADATRILFGAYSQKFIEGLIMLTSLGSINGLLMTGSRVVYAVISDRENDQPSSFHLLPFSLCLVGILSLAMVVWGDFEQLLFFTGIFVWLFFALIAAGLLIQRRKFHQPSGFESRGSTPRVERDRFFYPVTPVLFFFVCLALFLNTLWTYPIQSFIGLGLVIPAIPIYYLFVNKGIQSEIDRLGSKK